MEALAGSASPRTSVQRGQLTGFPTTSQRFEFRDGNLGLFWMERQPRRQAAGRTPKKELFSGEILFRSLRGC
jgi:hypothetical protein